MELLYHRIIIHPVRAVARPFEGTTVRHPGLDLTQLRDHRALPSQQSLRNEWRTQEASRISAPKDRRVVASAKYRHGSSSMTTDTGKRGGKWVTVRAEKCLYSSASLATPDLECRW